MENGDARKQNCEIIFNLKILSGLLAVGSCWGCSYELIYPGYLRYSLLIQAAVDGIVSTPGIVSQPSPRVNVSAG